MARRTRVVEVPVETELYVVVTVPDDPGPDARQGIAVVLRYLADRVEDPAWVGGEYEATGGIDVDAYLVLPEGWAAPAPVDEGPAN